MHRAARCSASCGTPRGPRPAPSRCRPSHGDGALLDTAAAATIFVSVIPAVRLCGVNEEGRHAWVESIAVVRCGSGGAPEGVVSAAVIRALDGDMNGRLLARHDVKGDNEENRRIGEQELARCKAMGIEAGKVLRLGDMARSDNVIFSATGITKGDLLEGISRKGNIATTETLLIRGKSRTIRRIQSIHYLDRKDPEMQVHIL